MNGDGSKKYLALVAIKISKKTVKDSLITDRKKTPQKNFIKKSVVDGY